MTGPSTKNYDLGVKFTADETGMQRAPVRGTIKFAAFTDAATFGAHIQTRGYRLPVRTLE